MPVPTQITDHATRAVARLLLHLKDASNLVDMMGVVNGQVQAYEDAIFPMLQLLDIDAMSGDQLDVIGSILFVGRNGASDANYRIAIRAKIQLIISNGCPDEIIDAFKALTGSTDTDLLEDDLAGYGIWGDAASYPSSTLTRLAAASVGGVYVALFTRLRQEGSADLITTEASDAIYLRSESTGR